MANITMDFSTLIAQTDKLKSAQEQGWPITRRAVEHSLSYVQRLWIEVAQGQRSVNIQGKETTIKNRGYAESIATASLIYPYENFLSGAVVPSGPIPIIIERGSPPFDMKQGLLRASKLRTKTGKPYAIVPFRVNRQEFKKESSKLFNFMLKSKTVIPFKTDTEGNITQKGTVLSQRMMAERDPAKYGGRPFAAREQGYMEAKFRWYPRIMSRGKIIMRGVRITDSSGNQRYESRASETSSANPPDLGYAWKAGKYQGMRKYEKFYRQRKGQFFMTFRAISEKSDPNSWIHPGFKPLPISEGIVEILEKDNDFNELIAAAVREDLGLNNVNQ